MRPAKIPTSAPDTRTFPPHSPKCAVDFPFSTRRVPWKSLFIHRSHRPPPAHVSHKAHRSASPEKAVEIRKFCIIDGFSPDLPHKAPAPAPPLGITFPNAPVCSRFSNDRRPSARRNFLPRPPRICGIYAMYPAVRAVNPVQPTYKSDFSTVSPPLRRLRLRIYLYFSI